MSNEDEFYVKPCLPLSNYFYKKGIERWTQPVNWDEKEYCCGTEEIPCVDCFICLIPFTFLIDLFTAGTCKDHLKKPKINSESQCKNNVIHI